MTSNSPPGAKLHSWPWNEPQETNYHGFAHGKVRIERICKARPSRPYALCRPLANCLDIKFPGHRCTPVRSNGSHELTDARWMPAKANVAISPKQDGWVVSARPRSSTLETCPHNRNGIAHWTENTGCQFFGTVWMITSDSTLEADIPPWIIFYHPWMTGTCRVPTTFATFFDDNRQQHVSAWSCHAMTQIPGLR
jgi:hypothetical protein